MSATPSPATWRPQRASDDLADQRHQMESAWRGKHNLLADTVQQARTTERADKHLWVGVSDLAADVRDRPDGRAAGRVGQQVDDLAFHVAEVTHRLVRLVGHRKVPPFGVTAGGQFTLSPRPIRMERPKLDCADAAIKGFRQPIS